MGCGISRELVTFTNLRLQNCHNTEGRYYLSELICEYVWGISGHDIFKWAQDKELLDGEVDYRSVIDMIRLCKKIKRHRGELDFTHDEQTRYLESIKVRNARKIGRHTIYLSQNEITGKTYEYLVTQCASN
jgi:hypothetical protein